MVFGAAFSGQASQGYGYSARWKVTEKSAKLDIADLKAREVIEFVGAPRKGSIGLKVKCPAVSRHYTGR